MMDDGGPVGVSICGHQLGVGERGAEEISYFAEPEPGPAGLSRSTTACFAFAIASGVV